MANEQHAFLYKDSVPDRAAWQAAIDQCGFDLKLHPDMKPLVDVGYSPCRLVGSETGVEVYYDGSVEQLRAFADVAQGRDFCISFRWGGSMKECACAMIMSYALAKHFGAIVSYEGDAPYADLAEFRRDTLTILEKALKGA